MNETAYEKATREAIEETQRPGGVANPFVLDIPEDAWRPTGDFDEDEKWNISDARTRLSCKIMLAGIMMHVEAIQVKDNQDLVEAANPQLDSDIVNLYEIAGWCGECPECLEIQGRRYILTAFPFA